MGGKRTESCGRCSVSSVLDATGSDGGDGPDGDAGDATGRNPFDGERIELEADQLERMVRHEVLARRVKDRLDDLATRLIYG